MKSTEQAIAKTLQLYVDTAGEATERDLSNVLSPYLAGRFSTYAAHALGCEFIVAEPNIEAIDLASIGNQLNQLADVLNKPVALYAARLDAGTRRALIESRLAFACATGDLYLPFLAINLRATSTQSAAQPKRFRASDCSAYLYGLYARDRFTQSDIMKATELSSGSVSRALSNLCTARLLDYVVSGKTGRKKEYFRTDDTEYYVKGRRLFGSPVRSTVLTNELPDSVPLLRCGLTALARSSNLVGPRREEWAVGPAHAGSVAPSSPEPNVGHRYAVNVLSYDPTPFESDGCVDAFTMLATISSDDLRDERVQMAIDEALEGLAWYKG